jgi:hypothetical protein
MAEAVVCTAIVGVLLVAAFNTAAFARTIEYRTATRERGLLLASELLAEISSQAYCDAQLGKSTFGLETGEAGNGSRALWDDFDDYNGWEESPPQAKDGTVIAGLTGWKRQVSVQRLSTSNLGNTSLSETGLKLCVVTVSRNGAQLARLASLRSEAWVLETP